MKSFCHLLVLASAFAFSACSTVPGTGRPQLIFTDPAFEANQGAMAFREYKSKKSVVTSGPTYASVQRVGKRIAAVAPVRQAKWEFVVFQDSEPNAFALPGGKVGINTGIMPIARDDAGLATVIAHEVAHVVARHGGERASHGIAASVGAAILDMGLALGTDLPPASRGAVMSGVGVGTNVGIMLPFSRAHENEADRLGLMYMAEAGYDPRAAIGFWQRMAAASAKRGGKPPAFLSTHPADESRIANLEKLMPAALAIYQKKTGRN